LDIFNGCETIALADDMLYIKDNVLVTISAIDLMILGPMLSGDLLFFRLEIFF